MKTENESKEPASASGVDSSDCFALARRIAIALLTVYDKEGGTECHRAQLMLKQPDGSERNMGGRNKQSIANKIERLLREHAHSEE